MKMFIKLVVVTTFVIFLSCLYASVMTDQEINLVMIKRFVFYSIAVSLLANTIAFAITNGLINRIKNKR